MQNAAIKVHHKISNVLNEIFERSANGIQLQIINFLTLPKLKKTQGPVKNLLPITLLEIINLRKSQNAYIKCRSVTNVVQLHQCSTTSCPLHSRQYTENK